MAEIEKVIFDLEVITPMFLSGANQNDIELRPQSIKGALRYWYRALLGGIGITQVDQLKKIESALWGTEEQGSSVVVRVRPQNMKKKDNKTLDLGYDKARKQTRNPGKTYLLFSTFMGGNNRPYYDAGSTFTVELLSNRVDAKKWLSLASCTLWCLVSVGAIGTRTRRGGGDLRINKIFQNTGMSLPEIKTDFSDVNQYTDYLSHGLQFCRKEVATLNDLNKVTVTGRVDFPIINSNYLSISVLNKTWNNWSSAMEEIGNEFMKFRKRRNPDYTNVKNFISRSSEFKTVERAYFGFPIIFRYNSLGGKSATVTGNTIERRASPLWFKFIKLDQNKYTVVLIFSKDEILPLGEKMKIEGRGSTINLGAPLQGIVVDFLSGLKSFGLTQVSF